MSKRLSGYDYSQPGFYFVTICTQQHRLVLSTIVDGQKFIIGGGRGEPAPTFGSQQTIHIPYSGMPSTVHIRYATLLI